MGMHKTCVVREKANNTHIELYNSQLCMIKHELHVYLQSTADKIYVTHIKILDIYMINTSQDITGKEELLTLVIPSA